MLVGSEAICALLLTDSFRLRPAALIHANAITATTDPVISLPVLKSCMLVARLGMRAARLHRE